jgi:2-(1,2-epoxy-1,2-dihydrophenyl)acetyl-CoA isomerase
MALLGDTLFASDAKAWGLIWDCVADEELMPTALTLAGRLADGPTAGLKAVVKAHDRALSNTFASNSITKKRLSGCCSTFHTSARVFAPSLKNANPILGT